VVYAWRWQRILDYRFLLWVHCGVSVVSQSNPRHDILTLTRVNSRLQCTGLPGLLWTLELCRFLTVTFVQCGGQRGCYILCHGLSECVVIGSVVRCWCNLGVGIMFGCCSALFKAHAVCRRTITRTCGCTCRYTLVSAKSVDGFAQRGGKLGRESLSRQLVPTSSDVENNVIF